MSDEIDKDMQFLFTAATLLNIALEDPEIPRDKAFALMKAAHEVLWHALGDRLGIKEPFRYTEQTSALLAALEALIAVRWAARG